MRWTIRGIEPYTADAVRDVAYETGSTLGQVLKLCVDIGLTEARRRLEAEIEAEWNSTDSTPETQSALIDLKRLIEDYGIGTPRDPQRTG